MLNFFKKHVPKHQYFVVVLLTILIRLNSDADKAMCDSELTIDKLKELLLSMENDKSPGNDGLTKEFYEAFWDDISQPLFMSLLKAKDKKKLASSQRQAVIKLLEKKGRDKRYIKIGGLFRY